MDETNDRVAVDDSTSRVPPLARPWSEEDAAGIGAWGHPSATYPPLLLTRTLQRHPQLAARLRHLGEGLYLDGRLSHRDRTIASAWSLRARPGAPVSTPLTWEQLAEVDDPAALNLTTVPALLAADGDPWADMDDVAHPLDPLLLEAL